MRPLFDDHDMVRMRKLTKGDVLKGYDAICFNEAFEDMKRHILLETLASEPYGYKYSTDTPGEDEGIEQDSGLFIASKHEIVLKDYLVFDEDKCSGSDCLAEKGAAYVKIRKGNTFYHMICTHLQAQDGEKDKVHRLSQFRELRKLVERNGAHISRNDVVMYVGDMNVHLYDPERRVMETELNARFGWPDGCRKASQSGARTLWVGTAPFCGGHSSDCGHRGCVYTGKFSSAGCTSGKKVYCRCNNVQDACDVYSYDEWRNQYAGPGTDRQFLDYTMYHKDYFVPSCHRQRVVEQLASDHFPVQGVFHKKKISCGLYDGASQSGSGTNGVKCNKKQHKWIGTAPFCSASADDCKDDWKFVKLDNSGDGSTCVTGDKVLCERCVRS
jgi:endonuclease/exonuclease/phosphatase family metal-dependent hydrolase